MKNTIKLLVLLVAIITLSSCEEGDLGTISITTTLSDVVHAESPQTPTADFVTFEAEETTLNIDNDETHEYINHLEELSFESLTFTFVNFVGDETGVMNLVVADASGNILFSEDNINVSEAVADETEFVVTNLADLNAVSAELLEDYTATISYEGSYVSSEADMTFDIVYNATIHVETSVPVE